MKQIDIARKNYFWPKLLTCWIPSRIYRRAFRGILTIGITKYFKILREDKSKNFDYEFAIGAIMKNEGPYLKEWLDFHILVGVQKFYLYDNDSTDDTEEILKPYIKSGIVEYKKVHGRGKQREVYLEIVNNHRNKMRWLCLLDLDEFLFPVKHKTVQEFLHTLPTFSQLIIGWVIYGSSGHEEKPDGLVIENYKKHAKVNWGIKSIINPRMMVYLNSPHSNYVAGFTIDETGRKRGFVNQEKEPTSHNFIRCNHYITKSHAEYIARCNLGDAGSGEKVKTLGKDPETNFKNFDKSEVYDPIMDKYIEKLKNEK